MAAEDEGEDRVVVGRVLFRQEHRFTVVEDDGTVQLFLLTHDAGVEGEQLDRWQQEKARIAIHCRREPHLIALAATNVRAVEPASDLSSTSPPS